MTPVEIKTILDNHAKWLADTATGKRADLHEANLRFADLGWADFSGANLTGATIWTGWRLEKSK